MSGLVKRAGVFTFRQRVPADVRDAFGRAEVRVSLRTSDEATARRLKAKAEAAFLQEVAQVRSRQSQNLTPIEREARPWQDLIFDEDELGIGTIVALDHLEKVEREKGEAHAQKLAREIFSRGTPLKRHRADWERQIELTLAPQTVDLYKRCGDELPFTTLEEWTRPAVTKYLQGLLETGSSRATLRIKIAAWRSFWHYLQDVGVLEEAAHDPMAALRVLRQGRQGSDRDAREPWAMDRLKDFLKRYGDVAVSGSTIMDVCTLLYYTGARVDEMFNLKAEDIDLTSAIPSFRVRVAKTQAGVRSVPVDPRLLPTVTRLLESRRSDYLLPAGGSGHRRSKPFITRFSKLKAAYGMPGTITLHSLRHTVATQLINAGVSEVLVGRLQGRVGGSSVTLSTYYHGPDMQALMDAVGKLQTL